MLKKTKARKIRHVSLRKKLSGSPSKPRLAVFRSNRHIYAQIIDDVAGKTVASASSLESGVPKGSKSEVASAVGKLVAQRAKEKGVEQVVFDRGGFKFQGRVAEVASGAREEKLKF